jgi:large subunit ribosomal protein L25
MRTKVIEIEATVRTEVGKGAAKRLRAAGQVPAVVYARGREPMPIALDEARFRRAIPEGGWYSTPLRLVLQGAGGGDAGPTAMVTEVQRDRIRDRIVAIDFHAVSLDEPVRAQVPIRVIGESAAVKQGGIVEVLMHEVAVEALPTELPDHLDVDVTKAGFHDHLRVGDLLVPPGVAVLASPEEAVLVVAPPAKVEEPVAAVETEEPEVLQQQELPEPEE